MSVGYRVRALVLSVEIFGDEWVLENLLWSGELQGVDSTAEAIAASQESMASSGLSCHVGGGWLLVFHSPTLPHWEAAGQGPKR